MQQALATLREFEFAGNAWWRIAALFGAVLLGLLLGKMVQVFAARAAERTRARRREAGAISLNALARSAVPLLFTLGLKHGLAFLRLGPKVADLAGTVTAVMAVCAIGWLVYCLVDLADIAMRNLSQRTASTLDDMLVPMVRKSLRVTVVVLVLVQVAQTLSDRPITSIIAGLGVGGLAVALAAQETIKNFFGSLVILGDKPFELGDRIVVDGHDGPVEQVGFRSTKVRTLDGHLVTIPNGELANKTILNIGKRPYIRRLANVTITYDTPPEKVQRALDILRELLANHEGMHPDFPPRVFFTEFNSDSLNLLAIYWYHPPSYWDYLAFGERLNMQILRRFNEEGIDFAFPTQTLYLAGDEKRPLRVGTEPAAPAAPRA